MKRRIAILMLVCANILLFAHLIVPHHHHAGVAAIILAECEDSSSSHDCDGHHHSHSEHHSNQTGHSHSDGSQHHSGQEECHLSKATLSKQIKLQKEMIKIVALDVSITQVISECDLEIFKEYAGYIEHKYNAQSIYAFGLRGPPIC